MGASEVRYLTWKNFLEAYENYYKPPPEEELNIPHILYKLTKIDEKERKNKLAGIIGTWKYLESNRNELYHIQHSRK